MHELVDLRQERPVDGASLLGTRMLALRAQAMRTHESLRVESVDLYLKEARSRFIELPSKLCTDGARAEIEWFFKPMVDELVGAPRTFANTLETVDRCVSWRKTKGPELAAALRQP